MRISRSPTSNSSDPSIEQIADMLAVVVWADLVLADEVQDIRSSPDGPALRTVSRLESLLVSLRPVADARAELARLNSELLLDGFEVWAARQREVMQRLSASASDSL